MSYQEEATEKIRERNSLSGRGNGVPPDELNEVTRAQEVWSSLLRPLLLQPKSGRRRIDGWISPLNDISKPLLFEPCVCV